MKNLITSMPALMALALAGGSRATARTANMTGMSVMDAGTGAELYTGANDPSIQIPGNVKNFAMEGYIGQQFTLTIRNTAAALRTVRLFAGYNTGDNAAASGQLADGDFNDTAGNAGLTATSSDPESNIRGFQRYVKDNPTRVVHLRIQTTVAEQLQQAIKVRRLDPFNQKGATSIVPALVVGGNQFNDKIAYLTTEIQLDDLSDILMNVVPTSSTTLTFFCGATLSRSQELEVKAAVAKSNLALR